MAASNREEEQKSAAAVKQQQQQKNCPPSSANQQTQQLLASTPPPPPYYHDVEIDVEAPMSEVEVAAGELIRRLRPHWMVGVGEDGQQPQGKRGTIEFKVYTNGITNKIFRASFSRSQNDKDLEEKEEKEQLLFRVYGRGTEKFIDRRREVENFIGLSRHGLAAPVFARFRNGIVCGFLEGRCLDVDEVKEEAMVDKITACMARMHHLPIGEFATAVSSSSSSSTLPPTKSNTSPTPILFSKLREFFDAIPTEGFAKDTQRQLTFKDYFTKNGYDMKSECAQLEARIESMSKDLRVVFCHNDLLVYNILYDADKELVHFIDYEYADFNYQLFDIANHFCVVRPCFDRCPNDVQKRHFLRRYLHHYYCSNADKPPAGEAKKREDTKLEEEVEKMLGQLPAFEAAAHLFWSVWALAQAHVSQIDFDYLDYSILRHQQFRLKLATLSSSPPSSLPKKE